MKKKVAFYGAIGSFSHVGAKKCFINESLEFIPCGKMFERVFEKVVGKKVEFGVVPVENNSHGIIDEVYDLLLEEKIYVVKESISRIEHYLLANRGAKICDIKQVYSHVAARSQCKKFLTPKEWKFIPMGDTAGAVEKLKAEKSLDTAAIASREAAEIYGMEILKENIQDYEDNYTRFFTIAREAEVKGANKTSIVLGLRNGLNSLYKYMGFFVNRNITIVNLESRPRGGKLFEYVIYMDFAGTIDDASVQGAIIDLTKTCQFLKFIGSYKAAILE